MLSICFIPLAAEVPVPFLVQVMVRVEKQRGHTFPKLVRSPERSCLVSQWQKKDISLPIGRKGRVIYLFLPIDV